MLQRRIFQAFFYSLRSAERLVPPSLLASIIWPAVVVFALGRSLGKAGRMWRLNFAAVFGRPPGLMPILRSFVGETYARLATLWPDRFMTPAWRSRFMVTGLDDLQACHAAGKPVVLAVIHAQPLNLLRLFLRANGLPVATLTFAQGVTGKRRLINAALDRSSSLAGVATSVSLCFSAKWQLPAYRVRQAV
jgi:lauroyl/myristoyl acyltransferase